MRYVTERGEFETLQELRYAYLQSGFDAHLDPGHSGAVEWDDKLLHASEIGYCPRRTMYRLAGADKKIQANLTKANEAMMFWIANRLHFFSYCAMKWAGILRGYEVSVMEPPWAGRVDALFCPNINDPSEYLYDLKTVRPAAIKYAHSFPKAEHCLQLGVYSLNTVVAGGVVEYFDRGGSNPPIECYIDVAKWGDQARSRMGQLEDWSKSGDLPPILEEQFTAHYRKARGKDYKELVSVTFDVPWQCSWCDYHHTTPEGTTRKESACLPHNHAPVELAKKEKGNWTFNRLAIGDPTAFDEWWAQQKFMVPLIGGEE